MTKLEYQSYLNSPTWEYVRNEVVKERKHCEICGRVDNLNVHHKTYAHVTHESMDDLVLLCHDCHEFVHKFNINI